MPELAENLDHNTHKTNVNRRLRTQDERVIQQRKLIYFVGLLVLIKIAVVVTLVILLLNGVLYQGMNQDLSSHSDSNATNDDELATSKNLHDFSEFDLHRFCADASCSKAAKEILSSLNTSVDPCDNFYNFACQGWLAQNPRPDHADKWGVFTKLRTQALHLVIDILNKSVETDELPVLLTAQRFYQKCLEANSNANQDKGTEERDMQFILDKLEEYGGWPILYKNGTWNSTRFSLMKTIFGIFTEFDLSQLGFLPFHSLLKSTSPENVFDSSSVMDTSTENLAIVAFIVNITSDLLQFSSKNYTYDRNYLESKAWEIVLVRRDYENFERQVHIAKGFESKATGNTVDSWPLLLDTNPDEIDVSKQLSSLYGNISQFVGGLKSYFSLKDENGTLKIEAIANYFHYQMMYGMVYLSGIKKFHEYDNTLRRVVYGTTKDVPTEMHCADEVQKKFPLVLGNAYLNRKGFQQTEKSVLKNLSESHQTADTSQFEQFAQIYGLFDDIKSEFRDLTFRSRKDYINGSALREVLKTVKFCPGYPTWILNRSRVQSEYNEISFPKDHQHSKSYMEQSIEINKWTANTRFDRLFVHRECIWSSFPGIPDAYNRFVTRVHISDGMLQLPFYDPFLPASLNYGRLGFIIGHEIAHSLVGLGWSKFANKTATPIAQCLIEQYNNYKFDDPQDKNLSVDGELTLTENLADNAGILAAYKAYKANSYLKDGDSTHKLNGLEKYTDDQLFYIGFAQNLCRTATKESIRKYLERDVHSPCQFRVLGTLQNSPEFAQAWKCPVGSNMNPKPTEGKDKCIVF